MTTSVFIDGGAGTTGLEIRTRLADRAEFSLITLPDDQRKDPAARRDAINDCDVAILCLPDDAARDAAAMIANDRTCVIDASTAHRVMDGWTYGFPELVGRDAVARAKRISNPGCYPTGFLALIAPLVKAGLLPAGWAYSVNAVSGYSGGGNALIDRFVEDPNIAWRGYGLGLGHKHLAEMQHYAGLDHAPVFSPAVVDAHRGMMVDVPLPLGVMQQAFGNSDANANDMRDCLTEFYAGSPIVSIAPADHPPAELLLHKDAAPWDGLQLFVFGNGETGPNAQARLIARLDNLGKGASGAAVQSLNLISGLPEAAGLAL